MKLKNILFTSLLVTGLSYSADAQFVGDAFRFSQENSGGTARFKGLGNAKTALGGDISSITGNPAGLGFFGQSDMSITVNYNNANNKGTYFGNRVSRNKDRFGIDHAGVVFHFPSSYGQTTGWQNFNVGFSYENTNIFHENIRYEGNNPLNTIGNAYADMMTSDPGSDWTKAMYNTGIAENIANDKNAFFPILGEKGDKYQVSDVLNHGYNSRSALAFGANYNNKFYIGMNVGFTAFRYETSQQFSESGWTKNRAEIIAQNPNSNIADPNHDDYALVEANYELLDDYLQVSEGTGVDFKIGAIYKPTLDWNIGATIQSPTWMTIDDYTDSFIAIDYFDNEQATSPFLKKTVDNGRTDDQYRTISPWRFSLGLTKFFSRGLITADAEYIDYSSIKVRTSGGYYNNTQERKWDQEVKDSYQGAFNFKIGGEILMTNILSARAGFNYYGNPYKGADNEQYSGSVGLGAKLSNTMYLDLAVVHLVNDYKTNPYRFDEIYWKSPSPIADVKLQRTSAVLTLGAKF